MPDYFVPLDTTLNSHYLNELHISTALEEYTFNYAETNKEKLEDTDFETFLTNFDVTDQMLDDLVKTGERNNIKPDYRELRSKKKLFKVHVKARIARKIWGNEGLYPVFNETNEVFQQAIKMFDRIPELKRREM